MAVMLLADIWKAVSGSKRPHPVVRKIKSMAARRRREDPRRRDALRRARRRAAKRQQDIDDGLIT